MIEMLVHQLGEPRRSSARPDHREIRDTPPGMVDLALGQSSLDVDVGHDVPCISLDLHTPGRRSSERATHGDDTRRRTTTTTTNLEQSRAEVRPNDELDTLDLRLHEHDPEMFFL